MTATCLKMKPMDAVFSICRSADASTVFGGRNNTALSFSLYTSNLLPSVLRQPLAARVDRKRHRAHERPTRHPRREEQDDDRQREQRQNANHDVLHLSQSADESQGFQHFVPALHEL